VSIRERPTLFVSSAAKEANWQSNFRFSGLVFGATIYNFVAMGSLLWQQ
jgi:hypothetical protein